MKTFTKLSIILAVLFSLVVMVGCEPQSKDEPQSEEWYSGGTLHKATVGEWHQASYDNRLATCADWVVVADRAEAERDFSTVKPKAIELEICITEATVDIPEIQNHDVVEYATICIILLDYQK